MQPFLKWAGGKRWLVQQIPQIFPFEYNTYLEPFLGSAACFFYLEPERSILSDTNGKLIETYLALKKSHAKVHDLLKYHARNHSEAHYYKVRAQKLNALHTKSAQFIYLNRTCYNGLYRENKKGIFNVPKGTKTSVILSTDDFNKTAGLLKHSELCHCDFEDTIDRANEGDLIFADPPYTTAHNLNGFVKYNQNIFSWKDQERLKEALVRADMRGVKILVTNAAHQSILELYSDFGNIFVLNRRSVISGLNKGRSDTSEFLISNYKLPCTDIEELKLKMPLSKEYQNFDASP